MPAHRLRQHEGASGAAKNPNCTGQNVSPPLACIPANVTSFAEGELTAGLTRPELLKALEGGKALRAASLVLRFAQ